MGAVEELRAATAADHEAVDAAFARFDLSDPAGYRGFLNAHARALPAVEATLAARAELPTLRPRTGLIEHDLANLGVAPPERLPFDLADKTAAAAFGAAYVLEGSRLGGGLLSRRVAVGLPSAYLSSTHLPGEWRGFLAALTAASEGERWIAEAVASARAVFALYRRAAGENSNH